MDHPLGNDTGPAEGGRGSHLPGRRARRHGYLRCFSRPAISPGSGKRPVSFLENTGFPSAVTSKTPPLPAIRFEVTPSDFFSSSAKLAARGL